MTPKHLRAVETVPERAVDIGRLIRAEIAMRDWERVHVEAERRPAVDLPSLWRTWRPWR